MLRQNVTAFGARGSTRYGRVAAAIVCALLLLGLAGAAVVWLRMRPFSSSVQKRVDERVIFEAAGRHRVSPFLVKAVIARESAFNPWAVGAKGEIGLMQITKGAVEDWERHTGQHCPLPGLLFDPRLNIEIGTWYLGRAVGSWRQHRDRDVLALAQYNAGRQNALKWAPKDPREEVHLSRISFPSTREYIRVVLANWQRFEQEYDKREKN